MMASFEKRLSDAERRDALRDDAAASARAVGTPAATSSPISAVALGPACGGALAVAIFGRTIHDGSSPPHHAGWLLDSGSGATAATPTPTPTAGEAGSRLGVARSSSSPSGWG